MLYSLQLKSIFPNFLKTPPALKTSHTNILQTLTLETTGYPFLVVLYSQVSYSGIVGNIVDSIPS